MSANDDLLCALDQLTNTVYWCRQRGMPTTAGSAILEAVGDWLDSQGPSRDDVPSVTADAASAPTRSPSRSNASADTSGRDSSERTSRA